MVIGVRAHCNPLYIYIYIYIQSIDLFHDSSRFLHQIFDFISRLHQGDIYIYAFGRAAFNLFGLRLLTG